MLYYKNNQYVYIENIIENMEKIEEINIVLDKNNKLLDELDVYERDIIYYDKDEIIIKDEIEEKEKIEEPNILILYSKYDSQYQKINDKINFENIYYSVKILITDENIIKNRWQEIPETVEYIIIKRRSIIENEKILNYDVKKTKIYKNNRDKFNFIRYNDDKEIRTILRELIYENIINEYNIDGDSVLYWCSMLVMKDEVEQIIKLVDDKIINKVYNENTRYNNYYPEYHMIIHYLYKNKWKDIIIDNLERFKISNVKNYEYILDITVELLILEDKTKIKMWLKNINRAFINKKILNIYSNKKIKEEMIHFLINELDNNKNKEYITINI